MRTLKNNGLVTTLADKTVKIDQGIKKSRNGNIWTKRDFSNEVIFIFFIFLYNYPLVEEAKIPPDSIWLSQRSIRFIAWLLTKLHLPWRKNYTALVLSLTSLKLLIEFGTQVSSIN